MTQPTPSTRPRFARWRAAKWLVSLSYRADPRRTLVALIPLAPICFGAVAVAARTLINGAIAGSASQVTTAGIVAGLGLFLGFASTYIQFSGSLLRLRESISLELDRQLLALSGSIPTLDHFHGTEFSDRVELMRTGKAPLTMVGGLMTQVVFGGASLLISAALLGFVAPPLAVAALAPLAVSWWYRRTERGISAVQESTAEERRAGLHLFDVGTGLPEGKELRVFGLQQRLLDRYRSSWQGVDATINHEALRAVVRRGPVWALYCMVLGLGLAFSTDLVIHGHSSAGDAFLVVWVLIGLGDQGANLAGAAAQVETTLSLAEQFVALREDAEGQSLRATPHGALPAPDRVQHGIELLDVGFRYPNAQSPALDGISMLLPAGAAVAVVGENGAGKTTLVNLLLGLQRPTTGRITVDGVSLAALEPMDWFARASVVCQDFARLELVVRESVGVGLLLALDDEAQVRSAVGRGGAQPIVTGLPKGLETQLGARFGGSDLSGGEWQRLAVARSMMRRQPLFLVLDEPTVSLDAMTERSLFSQLIGEAREAGRRVGSILLLVSHRYATVQEADLIVVLDRGQVVERGSHSELMALGGRYAQAYRRQADAYR